MIAEGTRALLLALLPAPPAGAAVIHVLADGSGDYPTIQKALDLALPGDLVSLGDGVFFEHDLVLRSQVSLASDSGDPARTALDAAFAGRCIAGTSVTGAPTAAGITFRRGLAAGSGGPMLADANNVRFHRCVFRDGSAADGGAVALVGASGGRAPQFFDGLFLDCGASRDGGALCSVGGREFQFYGNRVTLGELANDSAARGGALYVDRYDSAEGCLFFANAAQESGGALHLVDVTVSKEFQHFSGNVMAENRAGLRGGAVAVTGSLGLFERVNSTLAGNEAPEGAHLWSDRPDEWGSLRGSVLAFGAAGAAVAGAGTVDAACCDVYGNAGGDYAGPLLGEEETEGNLSADPRFCDPASRDFRPAEGSPCLPPLPAGCGFYGRIGAFGTGCAVAASVPGSPAEDSRDTTGPGFTR